METYEPTVGTKIENACESLAAMSSECGKSVAMTFNDIEVVATPESTAESLIEKWRRETQRRWEAYKSSPEGIAAKARQEEARRLAEESAKEGIVAFDVSDEAAWNSYLEVNRDDGYGEAVLRYAARWARLMEQRIAAGESLESVADEESRKADTEGVSGFMHGLATSVLVNCWRHGESLRAWNIGELQK